MPAAKPRHLAQKIDGTALFRAATSVEGLMDGWRKVAHNDGAAGGDGITTQHFGAQLAQRLIELSRALRDGSYQPGPLREVAIPKPKGGTRGLKIPCVADRVAQTAVAQQLGPKLEAEFEDASFGYRPGRGVDDAIRRVESLRREGFVWTLDADIDDYFDSVPVDRMMDRLARSVSESPLTSLIGLWLEHGARIGRGLPQGSPLSPLLANLYLDDLDEAFSGRGLRIVRYADDFVILAKDRPALEETRGKLDKLLAAHGLRLDAGKTAIRAYDDTLAFLGHKIIRGWALKTAADEMDDSVGAALRQVAEADAGAEAAAQRLASETAERDAAGLDRGLRLLHVRGRGRTLTLRNLSFSVHAAAAEARPDGHAEIAAIHHSRIDRIEIGPDVGTDAATLRHALACDIPVAFVSGHGKTLGQLAPVLGQRAHRHLAQARHALDPALALALARILVKGRLANQRVLLRRVNHRRGLAEVARTCVSLHRIERRLPVVATLEALRGWEGAGTKLFWRAWNALLLHGFSLPRRVRRANADPVNIVLDVLAGLLARDVGAIAVSAGLHPGFGTLHAISDYRDAGVYDLMEEFRAGLVESVALAAINTQRLRLGDFARSDDGAWRIGREGMDILIRAYEERCEHAVLDPRRGRRVTWRRLIREQADRYGAHVEGRQTYIPYVMDH